MKKCIDCGHTFADNLEACPSCGCPADLCPVIVQPMTNAQHQQQNYAQQPTGPQNCSYKTTDTGTSSERIIKKLGDVIWWILVIGAGLNALIKLIAMGIAIDHMSDNEVVYALTTILSVVIETVLFVMAAYVIRAFFRVIHNISINLHEINMKTK